MRQTSTRTLPDSRIEFVENPETTITRLQKIKSGLSDLAEKHLPLRAYTVLLSAGINHIAHGQNKMFYFPIPWEVDTGLPSLPSLIADARHYCRSNNFSDTTGIVVDSFAEWRVLQQQRIFCCCGKGSIISRERIVPVEIVINHPISIDRESNTLEIKQLIGIRSTDRDHIENHYNLRRDSRADSSISIIGTAFTRIGIQNLELQACGEEYAEQFDVNFFRKIFTELCQNTFTRPT